MIDPGERGPAPCLESKSLAGFTVINASTRANVAATDRASVIDTEHEVEVPEHAPDQPANVEPIDGVAVRVTEVSDVKSAAQLVPHEMPSGDDATVPEPVPDRPTVSVRVVGGVADGTSMCKSLSGSPQHSLSAPFVVAASIAAQTSAGVACGLVCRMSAAAPATCGDAIDVPLLVAAATSVAMPAETMLAPGANRSLHGPKFEKSASSSSISDAATVIASGTRAGLKPHEF